MLPVHFGNETFGRRCYLGSLAGSGSWMTGATTALPIDPKLAALMRTTGMSITVAANRKSCGDGRCCRIGRGNKA
jgi:hypothetical protein